MNVEKDKNIKKYRQARRIVKRRKRRARRTKKRNWTTIVEFISRSLIFVIPGFVALKPIYTLFQLSRNKWFRPILAIVSAGKKEFSYCFIG